jgi:hypothetical protein
VLACAVVWHLHSHYARGHQVMREGGGGWVREGGGGGERGGRGLGERAVPWHRAQELVTSLMRLMLVGTR